MKSGLKDRNNVDQAIVEIIDGLVSMKSGLKDRNNVRAMQTSRSEAAASQ